MMNHACDDVSNFHDAPIDPHNLVADGELWYANAHCDAVQVMQEFQTKLNASDKRCTQLQNDVKTRLQDIAALESKLQYAVEECNVLRAHNDQLSKELQVILLR